MGVSPSARIALAWLVGDVVVVAASVMTLAFAPAWVHEIFGLDGEANLPTWYATLQLAFAAWVWLRIARAALDASPADRRFVAGALLIGGALLFGSLDEASALHERIALNTADSLFPRTGYWVVAYVPILLAIGLGVVALVGRQLWQHRDSFSLVIGGAALFLLSAGGLELTLNLIPAGGPEMLEAHLEETGELIAVWLVLWGSLRLRDQLTSVPATPSRQ
jgi:hypothetical protein